MSFDPPRDAPSWLVDEPFDEIDHGPVKSGKEAQIDLVERIGADGRSCLVARKRYIPRNVRMKGQLEAMGFQRSSAFRHDVQYREGRQFRKSRDRRAVERMSTYGKHLLQDRWTDHEFDVMRRLWEAGTNVPYPIRFADDALDLEYLGDFDGVAPQLAAARLGDDEVDDAYRQLVEGLRSITRAGFAHGDLSAYNLLVHGSRLVMIDMPQIVDLIANPRGVEFLTRDSANVARWFTARGLTGVTPAPADLAGLLLAEARLS
jgi:RIO kinase 1